MTERMTCGCPKGPAPCLGYATQEDMLCDRCRADECQRQSAEWREMLEEMNKAAQVLQVAIGRIETT